VHHDGGVALEPADEGLTALNPGDQDGVGAGHGLAHPAAVLEQRLDHRRTTGLITNKMIIRIRGHLEINADLPGLPSVNGARPVTARDDRWI